MDNKDKQQSASFSLQNEIKKRRTQEIQRAIENKQIAQARGEDARRASQQIPSVPAPDPRRASQTIQSLDPRRASQTTNAVDSRRASQTTNAVDPRRASQTTNAVDPRRASQTTNTVDPRRASQQMNTVDPRRASQTTNAVDPRRASQQMKAVDSRRTSQTMRAVDLPRASQTLAIPPNLQRRRRQTLIVTIATLSIVAVCMLTMMFASNQQPTTAAAMQPVPLITVDKAIGYLKQVGMPITDSNMRVLAIDHKTWAVQAQELYEIQLQSGNTKGYFLLLSYSEPKFAVGDSMYVTSRIARFKGWQAIPIGNLLWLVQPESDKAIVQEMQSHLVSFVLRPYHDKLPRATSTPTPQGADGTAEADK